MSLNDFMFIGVGQPIIASSLTYEWMNAEFCLYFSDTICCDKDSVI